MWQERVPKAFLGSKMLNIFWRRENAEVYFVAKTGQKDKILKVFSGNNEIMKDLLQKYF